MSYLKTYSLILFCLLSLVATAQVEVEGTIVEDDTGLPLDYIQITIRDHTTKKLAGYAFTDIQGRFKITLPGGVGVYDLKTHSLSHESAIQPIVITDDETTSVNIDLRLQPKAIEIEGVEVTATRPPLVVRGDTLIYAASAFTDEADQTLEDILRKIPGLEVLADGELKVRGKNVDRVLINGEEVSNAKAALLTRGIDPRLVRDVEVRMNDQDQKLRKSLLDQNGLVVLDIKLKGDVSKRFGRLSMGVGQEQETGVSPGGLLNGFSLSKKANWHVITEYDHFGQKTVDLKDVKNLGREAYAAIFDVPADFNRLRENPEFDKELYGFQEGTGFEQATVGLSGAIKLGPNAKLHVGSYNVLDRSSNRNLAELRILADGVDQQFSESEDYQLWSSKNKVEYELNLPTVKFRYNLNAVLTDNMFISQQSDNETRRNFSANDREHSIYQNLFLEKRLPSGNGFQFNGLYSNSSRNSLRNLTDPDSALSPLLPSNSEIRSPLTQRAPVNSQRLLFKGFYRYKGKGFSLNAGLRTLYDLMEGSKELLLGGNPVSGSGLSAESTSLRFTQWQPYLTASTILGPLSWKGKLGYGFNTYSTFGGQDTRVKNRYEVNTNLTLALGEDELSLGYSRTTGQFPLLQQIVGVDLLDARTIGRMGSQALSPQPESLLRASLSSWALESLGVGLEVAGIAGRSQTSASTLLEYQPFATEVYDQLTTEYAIATLKVAKVFERLPLQLRAEQSFILTRQQNRLSSTAFFDANGRVAVSKLTAKTTFKDKPFNFAFLGKRSAISFGDELSEDTRQLNISSLTFSPTAYLLKRKLLFTANARYVSFADVTNSTVLLADLKASFRLNDFGFVLQAENVFDAQTITTQNVTGGIFSRRQRLLFGRSLRATVTLNL